MTCPTCNRQTEVVDTRSRKGEVLRRRQCSNRHRFSTLEKFVRHVKAPICEATGLRSYALSTVIVKQGRPMQCRHCNKWHLTPVEKTDTNFQQT